MDPDHLTRSRRNTFATLALDRAGLRRLDAQWLGATLLRADTRVVAFWNGKHPVLMGTSPEPVYLPASMVASSEYPDDRLVFLGEWEDIAYFSVDLTDHTTDPASLFPDGQQWLGLREVGAILEPRVGALFAYTQAMGYWHQRHRFCGDCGSPTRSCEGGHQRVCVNAACGQKHFPRTDPAVIMTVVDRRSPDGVERCLLGRQATWPAKMYSAIAGFVEPGESLEAAVMREVAEETGVIVDRVSYHSSQPWPFPGSLMLGFMANAVSSAIECYDDELEDVRWFSREDIVAGLGNGTLKLPSRVSIAYRLVEEWFDEGLPGKLGKLMGGAGQEHIKYQR